MSAKRKDIIAYISESGGTIGLLIIAFMVMATMADVTMRYFFNHPIAGVIEYCSILLPVMVFLGLASTQQAGGHIGMTLVLNRLKPRTRVTLETWNLLICFLFAAGMGVEAWKGALYSYSIKEYRWGVIGQDITIWWAKFAVSIGFWFLCLQYIADIKRKFTQIRRGQYLPEPPPETQAGVL